MQLVIPIKQLGFDLWKLEFWNAVHLRYGLPLTKLPINSGCSKPDNVQHAISSKKGLLLTLRQNHRKDNITEMLEVTSDVK